MCLSCGEAFTGPDAIRLRHGCIRQRKWGTEFVELPFEDHTKVKWVCFRCAWENDIVDDEGWISDRLENLGYLGQCPLCGNCIQPFPYDDWSSAILLEVGEMAPSTRGDFRIFRPNQGGHLHYLCMDDLHLELWRMIECSDEPPDFREWLNVQAR